MRPSSLPIVCLTLAVAGLAACRKAPPASDTAMSGVPAASVEPATATPTSDTAMSGVPAANRAVAPAPVGGVTKSPPQSDTAMSGVPKKTPVRVESLPPRPRRP